MGVVYSLEKLAARCGDTGLMSKPELLRPSADRTKAFVKCYQTYQYPSMVDNINLHSFFMNVDHKGDLEGDSADLVALLWSIYEVKSICYIQEIIACLILLSDETWPNRLSMLFEVFKSTGTEEMAYDDIVMMLQVVAMSLHRLWMATDWDQSKWSHLTESLSDGAYAKLEKELEVEVSKQEFVHWAVERFKAGRSVSSPLALQQLYSSSFD